MSALTMLNVPSPNGNHIIHRSHASTSSASAAAWLRCVAIPATSTPRAGSWGQALRLPAPDRVLLE